MESIEASSLSDYSLVVECGVIGVCCCDFLLHQFAIHYFHELIACDGVFANRLEAAVELTVDEEAIPEAQVALVEVSMNVGFADAVLAVEESINPGGVKVAILLV